MINKIEVNPNNKTQVTVNKDNQYSELNDFLDDCEDLGLRCDFDNEGYCILRTSKNKYRIGNDTLTLLLAKDWIGKLVLLPV